MDHQQQQQLDGQLRQNWSQLRHQILDQFAQVSTSDLDAAVNVTDLIQRISDKSDYSERFVETRITELVGVGVGQSFGPSFGQAQVGQSTGQGLMSQQPFGQTGGSQSQAGGSQRLGTSQP